MKVFFLLKFFLHSSLTPYHLSLSDVVEFEVIEGKVVLKPVHSVGGSLSQYSKEYVVLKDIRGAVWEGVD